MPPKKVPTGAIKNQPSVFALGVTSEVFPLPVDEKSFPDAKEFATQCNEVLAGQIVHVRGDYWEGALPHERSLLFPCKVSR
jgi:hypothetical protein